MLDVGAHNAAAWDELSRSGDRWTRPVDAETIRAARLGDWSVLLTARRPAPREWFPADMAHVEVLALASGGGQQASVLAAAGARVTLLDRSPAQLAADRAVAEREGLAIATTLGTMEDLSAFDEGTFDLIVNPASVMFTPDVRRVWRECARVLRPGGALLSGWTVPHAYLFEEAAHAGERPPVARYRLPYSDLEQLAPDELARRIRAKAPLEWSHTLAGLIGGQLEAGLHLVGLYEDALGHSALDAQAPWMVATRALKPIG